MQGLWKKMFGVTSQESSHEELATEVPSLEQVVVDGALEFTLKMNKMLYETSPTESIPNVLFSPINIYSALALMHLATDGTSQDELAELMGLPKGGEKQKEVHQTLSQLFKSIQATNKAITRMANGIFVQQGVPLIQSYISQVKAYYRGEVSDVNFCNNSVEATDKINKFISNETHGRIPELYTSPLSDNTRIVLAATLYFKASWQKKFNINNTTERNFNTATGQSLIKFMTKTDYLQYFDAAELQLRAVSLVYNTQDLPDFASTGRRPLPYSNYELSMFFVLPYENRTLDDLISSLDVPTMRRIIEQTSTTDLCIRIPRMKYKWSGDIEESLKRLGIVELFTDQANLGNMVNEKLKLSQVTHATEIEVDEEGTEAVAATTCNELCVISGKPNPILFDVNRPFLTFIYHHNTRTVLFMSAVRDPSA